MKHWLGPLEVARAARRTPPSHIHDDPLLMTDLSKVIFGDIWVNDRGRCLFCLYFITTCFVFGPFVSLCVAYLALDILFLFSPPLAPLFPFPTKNLFGSIYLSCMCQLSYLRVPHLFALSPPLVFVPDYFKQLCKALQAEPEI